MKITIDTDTQTVALRSAAGATTTHPLYSREAFRLVTGVWLKQEWSLLHWQSFSWLGFQLWQLPEDVMRLQEVVATLRPDIIIETGVNSARKAMKPATAWKNGASRCSIPCAKPWRFVSVRPWTSACCCPAASIRACWSACCAKPVWRTC